MKSFWARFLTFGLLATLMIASATAGTWQVPSEIATIGEGLTLAASGDTVLVACGTYFERDLVMKSGVTLRSESGQPDCVTIDGQSLGARLLDCVGTAVGTRIEGLTWTGGQAPSGAENFDSFGGAIRADSSTLDITDCDFVQNSSRFGGGVGARASSPVLTRCRFSSNTVADTSWAAGGGMYSLFSTAVLEDCEFVGNSAFSINNPGDGGGLFCQTTVTVVTGCTFEQNSTGAGGGAFYSYERDSTLLVQCTFESNQADPGGAVYIEDSVPTFDDCSFIGNSGRIGGAVYIGRAAAARFVDCVFDSNSASVLSGGAVKIWNSGSEFLRCTFTGNSGALYGGAVSISWSSDHEFTDCLFEGNDAAGGGGAIQLIGLANTVIAGCTLAGNSTPGSGGGVFCQESATASIERTLIAFGPEGAAVECVAPDAVAISCSNLYGNAGGDWVGCVASQSSSSGNLSQDPLFCDAAAGDYTVALPGSPCLPQNNTCGTQIGAFTEGCGCPASATIFVPADEPTIGAALAAASPGDVVGVCNGVYEEQIDLVSGIHLVGVGRHLCRVEWPSPGSPVAVLLARQISDSTVVEGLTLDGLSMAPQVVLAESSSTGLHLRSCSVTGGATYGIRNGVDSRTQLGGALAWGNDFLSDGAITVRNENDTADSLDASFNWWGTTEPDSIQARIEGLVRVCPVIVRSDHSQAHCPPPGSPVHSPSSTSGPGDLSLSPRPNPFSGAIRIDFNLPQDALAHLAVYDVVGRRVRTLHEGEVSAGSHAVVWSGRDDQERRAAPGIYFVRLEADEEVRTQKVLLLR